MPDRLPSEAAHLPLDEQAVETAKQLAGEKMQAAEYTDLLHTPSDDTVRERLLSEFTSSPIDNYLTELMKDQIYLNIRECLNVDLTEYVRLDMLYQWLTENDAAINVTGRPGKGKSNIGLSLNVDWCSISGKPFRLSNVVFQTPVYNLLLRGYKVRDMPDGRVELYEYPLQRGDCLMLDEASDRTVAGEYSATMISQTEDMEARMRAQQICRIACGPRQILHQSYYSIWALERNPKEEICTGIVYANESNDPLSPVHYIGSVRVPYVSRELYDAYRKPKMASIHGHSRSAGTNTVARIVKHFADELKQNKEFQALPLRPPAKRINWLQANPKYSIFQTVQSFRNLEMLSRPDPEEVSSTGSRSGPSVIGGTPAVR